MPRRYPYEGPLGAKLIELEAQGWHFDKPGKHLKFRSPHGQLFVLPRTPSDHKGPLNGLSDLKRLVRQEHAHGN